MGGDDHLSLALREREGLYSMKSEGVTECLMNGEWSLILRSSDTLSQRELHLINSTEVRCVASDPSYLCFYREWVTIRCNFIHLPQEECVIGYCCFSFF